ncbi:hypothetical protein C8R45DRAFT_1136081 [Mycena sanguinolenta]|nr:hypothetical protein C8R45DRAFT_1136081 [Mycena sanguinolenta]
MSGISGDNGCRSRCVAKVGMAARSSEIEMSWNQAGIRKGRSDQLSDQIGPAVATATTFTEDSWYVLRETGELPFWPMFVSTKQSPYLGGWQLFWISFLTPESTPDFTVNLRVGNQEGRKEIYPQHFFPYHHLAVRPPPDTTGRKRIKMPPRAFPTSKHTPADQECTHRPCQLRNFARDYVTPPSQSSDAPRTGYSPIWGINPTRRRPDTRLTQDQSPSQFSDDIELRALAANMCEFFSDSESNADFDLSTRISRPLCTVWGSSISVKSQSPIPAEVSIIGRTLTEITSMREEALAVESGRKVDMDIPTKSEQVLWAGNRKVLGRARREFRRQIPKNADMPASRTCAVDGLACVGFIMCFHLVNDDIGNLRGKDCVRMIKGYLTPGELQLFSYVYTTDPT